MRRGGGNGNEAHNGMRFDFFFNDIEVVTEHFLGMTSEDRNFFKL